MNNRSKALQCHVLSKLLKEDFGIRPKYEWNREEKGMNQLLGLYVSGQATSQYPSSFWKPGNSRCVYVCEYISWMVSRSPD